MSLNQVRTTQLFLSQRPLHGLLARYLGVISSGRQLVCLRAVSTARDADHAAANSRTLSPGSNRPWPYKRFRLRQPLAQSDARSSVVAQAPQSGNCNCYTG